MTELINHTLIDHEELDERVHYTLKPVLDQDGNPVKGLHSAWITLANEKQFNAYTTDMVKSIVLAFRKASMARDVVAVVFTGEGSRAFCTGGNTKEYAEYYAGRPLEYAQYLRLFNDMVSSILFCDKPVVCRVNGMRIGGGQEIGMACDITVASDMANFGQAGPKHGSAPDGGSTDFLPVFVGIEHAMISGTLCEPWSSYMAKRINLITDLVPTLRVNGEYVPNPLVITDRWVGDKGRLVYGEFKTGEERDKGKALLAEGTIDLAPLDTLVESLITKFTYTMPGCLGKTISSLRKHKLEHWDRNKETSREWLALNMMSEAKAGFRAFNEGPKGNREVDFLELRRALAAGDSWNDDLVQRVQPR